MVYDTPLEAKFLVYSAMTGELIAKHSSQNLLGLGIKSVSLSPNGIFMVAAYFDTKIRVYNAISQKEISPLEHVSQVNLSSPDYSRLLVYKEEAYTDPYSGSGDGKTSYQYVNIQSNKENNEQQLVKFPVIGKKEIQQFNTSIFEKVGLQGPPTGVSQLAWSSNSRYLATKCD
jgi:WD40 repeat protein